MTNLTKIILSTFIAMTVLWSPFAMANTKTCGETLTKDVTAKEFLRDDISYAELQNKAITQGIILAARSAGLGGKITQYKETHKSFSNKSAIPKSQRYTKNVSFEKIQALADSYVILREDIRPIGSREILELDMKVVICLSASRPSTVISVGDVKSSDGVILAVGRQTIISAIQQSAQLSVSDARPNEEAFADIIITGRVDRAGTSVRVVEEANPVAVIGGLLNLGLAMRSRRGRGVQLPAMGPSVVRRQVLYGMVSVSVTAIVKKDHRVITKSITAKKQSATNVNRDALLGGLFEFAMRQSVSEVMVALRDILEPSAREGNSFFDNSESTGFFRNENENAP